MVDKHHFINRKIDIDLLEKLFGKKDAQLLVVYGRRRVGKTALLTEFAKKNGLFHWIAYRSTSSELLKDFSRQLYAYLNDGELPDENFSYGSWKLVFETMAMAAARKKMGIIIDEFPYIVESDSSISSVLQAVWDKNLSHSHVVLGLSGSRVGMIKHEILESRGPLYGRATAVVFLQPIKIFELGKFFPKYSKIQLVETFGITGGIPKYFEFISDNAPVLKNIDEAIINRTTLFTAEADLLLNEEFRETRIYIAILRALGRSPLDIKGISSYCGLDSKVLSKYLDQLIELKFVERKIPAGSDLSKGRKSLYVIGDNFLNFYFRFIAPHLQDIEQGRTNKVILDIRNNFDSYIGKFVFEKICRDWLADSSDKKMLSFEPESIGEYWDREMQIDVVGINHHDQMMIAGEAKWTKQKVGVEVLRELESKARRICSKNNYHHQLVLFSRSGFTANLIDAASKRNVLLVTLNEIFK